MEATVYADAILAEATRYLNENGVNVASESELPDRSSGKDSAILTISKDKLPILLDECKGAPSRAWNALLNTDIRRLGVVRPESWAREVEILNTAENGILRETAIMQVISTQNIAIPNRKQQQMEASLSMRDGRAVESGGPRLLLFKLTDGLQRFTAIEYGDIHGLKHVIPPGMKLKIGPASVKRGKLLLTSSNTVVLGGSVSAMVEAWQRELQMSMVHTRGLAMKIATPATTPATAADAKEAVVEDKATAPALTVEKPPPFIPFSASDAPLAAKTIEAGTASATAAKKPAKAEPKSHSKSSAVEPAAPAEKAPPHRTKAGGDRRETTREKSPRGRPTKGAPPASGGDRHGRSTATAAKSGAGDSLAADFSAALEAFVAASGAGSKDTAGALGGLRAEAPEWKPPASLSDSHPRPTGSSTSGPAALQPCPPGYEAFLLPSFDDCRASLVDPEFGSRAAAISLWTTFGSLGSVPSSARLVGGEISGVELADGEVLLSLCESALHFNSLGHGESASVHGETMLATCSSKVAAVVLNGSAKPRQADVAAASEAYIERSHALPGTTLFLVDFGASPLPVCYGIFSTEQLVRVHSGSVRSGPVARGGRAERGSMDRRPRGRGGYRGR